MCLLYEKVVGVTFKNEDGSSRQKYIRQLKDDDFLTFESFEYEGETAFHVLDPRGHCIGNVPKSLVPTILDYYNKGYEFDIFVADILGKDEFGEWIDGYNAGVEMGIRIYDKKDRPVYSTSPGYVPKTPDPAPSVPPSKGKKKTGRVMIGFGIFFFIGFFVAFSPVCLVAAVLLLYFGIHRHKAFKSSLKGNGKTE